MAKFYKTIHGAALAASMLVAVGCGAPVDSPSVVGESTGGADLWALLQAALPSEPEALSMVQGARGLTPVAAAAAAPGLTPQATSVVFTMVQLSPVVVQDGVSTSLTPENATTITLSDGDLAFAPFAIVYEDPTTSFTGTLRINLIWDALAQLFFPANPPTTVEVDIPGEVSWVDVTVFNSLLDLAFGGVYDNGHLAGARGEVWLNDERIAFAVADDAGRLLLGPIPVDATYEFIFSAPGFVPGKVTQTVPAAPVSIATNLWLMPRPTAVIGTMAISGFVRDLDGAPIGDLPVDLIDDASGAIVAVGAAMRTNGFGEYAIHDVPLDVTRTVRARVATIRGDFVSDAFTVAASDINSWRRIDLTVANHAPTVGCLDSLGDAVTDAVWSIQPDEKIALGVDKDDADGDYLELTYTQQTGAGFVEDAQFGAFYTAPSASFAWDRVTVTADDGLATASCTFTITSGEFQ